MGRIKAATAALFLSAAVVVGGGVLPAAAAPTTAPQATTTVVAAAKKALKSAKPKVKGTAQVGKTLTVKPGKWAPGAKLKIQWLAGGKKIPGATKTSLKVTKKLVGKKISVKVTGKKTGFKKVTKKSTKTVKVKKAPKKSTGATAISKLLKTLPVKGRAPKTGYDRALFGPAWTDNVTVAGGRNGCDTRNDILRRDLTAVTIKAGSNGCTVETGTLLDPYTGATIRFTRGAATSTAVQIDHVVALSDAWQKGAQQLSNDKRTDFANDPINLLAVDGPTNAKKGDGDAATWLPPRKAFRCTYIALQVTVKAKYDLWVTQAEHDAIARILDGCGEVKLPNSAPPALVKDKPSLPDPDTTGCRPLSNAGNCYQPGQICRAADRGTSGIDGNGKAIRCLDKAGTWRWTTV